MNVAHTGKTRGTVFWLQLNLALFPDEDKYAVQIEDGMRPHQFVSYSGWDFCLDSDVLRKHQVIFTTRSAPSREQFFNLHVPVWAKDAKILVNSESVPTITGALVELKRVCQSDNTVVFVFSHAFTILPYTRVEQAENGLAFVPYFEMASHTIFSCYSIFE